MPKAKTTERGQKSLTITRSCKVGGRSSSKSVHMMSNKDILEYIASPRRGRDKQQVINIAVKRGIA
jgi:hypothetical protein|tara:strand:+ start:1410 stop:1607 length:198 start_codon:yes stop_codon:yes gene_type:complete